MRVIYGENVDAIGIWRPLSSTFENLAHAEAWVDEQVNSGLTVTIRPDRGGFRVWELTHRHEEPWED